MKNLRILYVGPASHGCVVGDVFAAANLLAGGLSPTDILARGDAEETDDEPTSEFHVTPEELAAAESALADSQPAPAGADSTPALDTKAPADASARLSAEAATDAGAANASDDAAATKAASE